MIKNAKCMFVILDFSWGTEGTLIAHSGGGYGDNCDIWQEESENSTDIDDMFCDDDSKPTEAGFWVWEGDIKPTYDDAPEYYGKWRKAIEQDMIGLLK